MNATIDRQIPRFALDLLSAPPKRGDGLNNWFFRCARVLHPYRTPEDIVETLRAATAGEQIQPGEIERAVENSKACAWQPGSPQPTKRASTWPAIDHAARAAVIAAQGQLADLWEISPIRFEDEDAEDLINALFPGDPLLCVGQTMSKFATRPRSEWRGHLAGKALIVPSPMAAKVGRTKDGKPSEHTLDNTGPRRFLIIEQDKGTLDEQAAVLMHLAERAPLALAVFSGGKSLHGWFYCVGQSEQRLHAFMRGAVALGADRALWLRSQFSRLPGGTHDNGKRQGVFFFNPGVLK